MRLVIWRVDLVVSVVSFGNTVTVDGKLAELCVYLLQHSVACEYFFMKDLGAVAVFHATVLAYVHLFFVDADATIGAH